MRRCRATAIFDFADLLLAVQPLTISAADFADTAIRMPPCASGWRGAHFMIGRSPGPMMPSVPCWLEASQRIWPRLELAAQESAQLFSRHLATRRAPDFIFMATATRHL